MAAPSFNLLRPKPLKVVPDSSLSHSLFCFISKSHWLYLRCRCRIWQLSLTVPTLSSPSQRQPRYDANFLVAFLTLLLSSFSSFKDRKPKWSLKIKSRSYCMLFRGGFLSRWSKNPVCLCGSPPSPTEQAPWLIHLLVSTWVILLQSQWPLPASQTWWSHSDLRDFVLKKRNSISLDVHILEFSTFLWTLFFIGIFSVRSSMTIL